MFVNKNKIKNEEKCKKILSETDNSMKLIF